MMGGFGGSVGGLSAKGKRPINVKFEIPYFTTSGIQVRYLKIIEPKVCEMLMESGVKSVWLIIMSSYNTRRCPGLDISRSLATLRSDCRTLHNNKHNVYHGNSSALLPRLQIPPLHGAASSNAIYVYMLLPGATLEACIASILL